MAVTQKDMSVRWVVLIGMLVLVISWLLGGFLFAVGIVVIGVVVSLEAASWLAFTERRHAFWKISLGSATQYLRLGGRITRAWMTIS